MCFNHLQVSFTLLTAFSVLLLASFESDSSISSPNRTGSNNNGGGSGGSNGGVGTCSTGNGGGSSTPGGMCTLLESNSLSSIGPLFWTILFPGDLIGFCF